MTAKPSYLVHRVDEKDVTVDWFFGDGRAGTKARQLVLVVIGWFFAVLPIVVTGSALLHRDDEDAGWWGYHEGFEMWDRTVAFLGILTAFFVVAFLLLHVLDRAPGRTRGRRTASEEERLALRLELAERLYTDHFGPAELRREQRYVEIQPYADLETYELRDLFREREVD